MNRKSINLDKLYEECKSIYGDEYDLSRIKTYGYNKKYEIEIFCKKHGWVKTRLYSFKNGDGCPLCKKESRKNAKLKYTTETYINEARSVHGDKYDLSKVVYSGANEKITVICPKHGEFHPTAYNFIHGTGCVECSYETLAKMNKKPLEQYIDDCKKVHGDKYIIDDTIGYIDTKHDVFPICRTHGRFRINASSFLGGCGCHMCSKTRPLTTDIFIQRANAVHNNYYRYDKTDYIDAKHKIKIICPIHGEFEQLPSEHLSGKGCRKCARQIYKSEVAVFEYVKSLVGECNVIQNDRTILESGREVDIYVPCQRIAIEYNGLVWHSEKFNSGRMSLLEKTLECEKNGIHLIHIFEDEWIGHEDLVKDKLSHMLHMDSDKIKIGARKCTVCEIGCDMARLFLEQYHIQGWASSSVYCGSFYDDNLIGVMSFLREYDGNWNLTRFSSNIAYSIPGLASKLFSYFIKKYNPIEIKTFLDRRWSWSDINVYDRIGFKLDKTLPPSYCYTKGQKRYHKFGFRKQILNKKYGLPLTMTEKEMCEKIGFYRIWDCGLLKYVWKGEVDGEKNVNR